eukprot:6226736-Prymnesium_polylepis.1
MYFVVDCKLKISGGPTPTKLGEEGGVVEVPAGAAPIFPAMAHQVENIGDKEGKAVFVEPYPNCKPCGDIAGYISPFAVSPGCCSILHSDPDRGRPHVTPRGPTRPYVVPRGSTWFHVTHAAPCDPHVTPTVTRTRQVSPGM